MCNSTGTVLVLVIWRTKGNCGGVLWEGGTKLTSYKDNKFNKFYHSEGTLKEMMQAFLQLCQQVWWMRYSKSLNILDAFYLQNFCFGIEVWADNQSKRQQSLLQLHCYWFHFYEECTTLHDSPYKYHKQAIFRTETIWNNWVRFWSPQNSFSTLMVIYRWNIIIPL